MKSRSQKKKEFKRIREKIPVSNIIVFTTFSRAHSAGSGQAGEKGLSVSQMSELKRILRSMNSEYIVAKKSLMGLALKELKYDGIDVFGMAGSVGLVFSNGDRYTVAKKLYEFSKKNPALQFFGALLRPSSKKVLEDEQSSAEQIFADINAFLEMAQMPSREALIGQLVGMLTYPTIGLCVVLGEVSKQRASAS